MNLGENEENFAIFKIILMASCETRNGFCQLYLFERILIRPKNCKDVNMTVLEIKSFFSNLFLVFFKLAFERKSYCRQKLASCMLDMLLICCLYKLN